MAQELRPSSRERRQGIPTSAILLIVLGVVLLLQTTGFVSWDLWGGLWRFWPVIIIAIGLNMFLGPRAPWLATLLVLGLFTGAVAGAFYLTPAQEQPSVTSLTEPLGNLKSANVLITFGGGELKLMSLPADSPNLVEGRFQTPGNATKSTLKLLGDQGDLRITMEGRRLLGGFSQADWEIALSRSPRLSINLDGGAAKMTLDLRDLQVGYLDIDTGASDVAITLPAHAGDMKLELDAGAVNVDVLVPQGVAARIVRDEGLSSFSVDSSRFPRSGDVYVSPDFDTAENRVAMEFRVGAANVTVR